MNIEVPVEQKVGMALEDVIKLTQKKGGQRKGNNNAGNGKANARPQSAGKNSTGSNNRGGNRRNNNNNNGNNQMDVEQNVRVAKSVGAAKANRNANINQKRGMDNNNNNNNNNNNTGKASRNEIRNEVRKQLDRSKNNNNNNPAASTGGLKISFKPGELGKTTEKIVSQQIKAVLSRQSTKIGTPRAAASPATGNNKSRPISANSSNGNGQQQPKRNNPKARSRTGGPLRVQR